MLASMSATKGGGDVSIVDITFREGVRKSLRLVKRLDNVVAQSRVLGLGLRGARATRVVRVRVHHRRPALHKEP